MWQIVHNKQLEEKKNSEYSTNIGRTSTAHNLQRSTLSFFFFHQWHHCRKLYTKKKRQHGAYEHICRRQRIQWNKRSKTSENIRILLGTYTSKGNPSATSW